MYLQRHSFCDSISIILFRLSLSTQIRDILGRDDIFKDSLRSRYTTLEDLLAHRMGFPSNNQIRLDDTLSRESLVEYVFNSTKIYVLLE